MATIKVTYNTNTSREHVLIDSSMTLRLFCEDNGVDYSRGGLNLDGSPLRPGDIDKTFDQMNVAEHCYLLSVVKADNAATVSVSGDAIVITSSLPLEDIKLAERYRPDALKVKGGEDNKETVFVVSANGHQGISNYGITFERASRSEEALATFTMFLTEEIDDLSEYIADKYGKVLLNLNKIEASLPAVLEEIMAEKAEVMSSIDIA